MYSEDEYNTSEAWLAEQIFSQLKDFKTEPLRDNEEDSRLTFGTTKDSLDYDESTAVGSSNVLELIAPGEDNNIQNDSQPDPDPKKNQSQDFFLLQEQSNEEYRNANNNEIQDIFQYSEPSFKIPQSIVECSNCNCIFQADSFPQHICDYGEDTKLIIPEPMDPMSITSYQAGPVEPPCIRLLRENQIRIRRFLKDELKYDVNAGTTTTKKQEGPHECTLCERKFVHASGLSRHMEKHALDLIPSTSAPSMNNGCPPTNGLKVVIKCTICGRIFYEAEISFKHLCMHFPKTNEAEPEFDEFADFPYENYLDDGLNFLKTESKMSNSKPTSYFKMVILSCVLQCEFCDLLFSEVSFLLAHSACHQPQWPFECFACEIHVSTSKDIFMHWQAECAFARESLKLGCTSQRYYVCNVCENKFVSLEQLHEHRYTAYHFFPRLDSSKGRLLLPCEYCGGIFETANDIVAHFDERHYKKNKQHVGTKSRQYLCDICGKTYTQSSHLWQHLRFHKGVKPFGCNEPGCSRRFTIRPDLNDHIRKCHTGERPYHCLICGRRFLTGSVFYQHRLIHRGERRYGCDECGKRFYRADALKNHLRIHTGEKPYGCLFCTKSFRQRGDRDKHIRARHSSLDAKSRLMMQMRKLQLEAAAKASANPSSSTPAEEVLMFGNMAFPKSMFQPLLPDIDAGQD